MPQSIGERLPPPEIARCLAAEIAALPVGTKLPSEHSLMRRFGVTRAQLRAAVDLLVNRHLVRRVHGSGTYVHRRVDYVISSQNPPSLHATVAAAGGVARTFLVDVTDVTAPADVAGVLGISPGTLVTRLTRIAYVDDAIASCTEEWLPVGTIDHADIRLKIVESLYELFRSRGLEPIRAWCRAATEFPPEPVERRLDLDGPTPTWGIETLTKDVRTRHALMYSRGWMRQDVLRVVFEFDNLGAAGSSDHSPGSSDHSARSSHESAQSSPGRSTTAPGA